MRVLVVFDSSLTAEHTSLPYFSEGNELFLFPLTSAGSFSNAMLKRSMNKGRSIEVLDTAALINVAADDLRDKYIRFVSELPDRLCFRSRNLKELFTVNEHATMWWFSLIAEKNTFKSDAFNRLAQLDAIVKAIKDRKIGRIVFACKNDKLRNAIVNFAYERSIEVETLKIGTDRDLRTRFKDLQRYFIFKHTTVLVLFFLSSMVKTWRIKKRFSGFKRSIPNEDALLQITYYPNIDTSAAEQGIFRNKYCLPLQDKLGKEGINVVWAAMYVKNNTISFEQSLNYSELFIRKGLSFFWLEEFITVWAQVKSLLFMLGISIKFLVVEKKLRNLHDFGDYNFYDLFRDDWYASFSGSTGYSGLLYYHMFQSLLSSIQVKKCLYFCEMHAWEKALIYARDTLHSRTRLFGYQSGTVSKMLLNYFSHPEDLAGEGTFPMAVPDRVICNGKIPYSLLAESGWSQEKLFIAEAIRYNHLKKPMASRLSNKKDVVLLAFSISPEESSAILNLFYEAFNEREDITVWMKPHPFLQIEEVFRRSGIRREDCRFILRNEPIDFLLSDARVVIVGESSVSIEALAWGCNVIIVKVPEWINMSSLRNIKSPMIKTISTSTELINVVAQILNTAQDLEKSGTEANKIIHDFFCMEDKLDVPERFMQVLYNEVPEKSKSHTRSDL